jgi:osmoprotectant transport system substrate-binding protein
VLVAACETTEPAAPVPEVVVGVGSTVEQTVLAALATVALEETGFAVRVLDDLGGTRAVRGRAARDEIDLWWDQTGAAWALGLRQQAPPADPVESYERVAEEDADNGFTWLEPTSANATLAFLVPESQTARTLTDLSRILSEQGGVLCADEAFIERPEGLQGVAEVYAIDLDALELRAASEQQAIAGVTSGRCTVGLASATSGAAAAAGLVPVVDDLGVFPAFLVAPVVRAEVLERHPEIAEVLASVAALIDSDARLAALAARVGRGEESRAVAEDVLLEAGLIAPQPSEGA